MHASISCKLQKGRKRRKKCIFVQASNSRILELMQTHELLRLLIEVAMRVGKHIKAQQAGVLLQDISYKGKHDLVTETDKQVEAALVEALGTMLPGSGFLTEEQTVGYQEREYVWVIDPIDGTSNFIHGVPFFSISIALKHQGESIIGLVYDVMRDECFYASKGAGAFLNGHVIHCSYNRNLDKSMIGTGMPYSDYSKLDEYMMCLKEMLQQTRGVRRLGSAALDLCYVAAGRFDAFYEYGLKEYDVAAGALIVQEAGGKLVDFHGGNNFVLSSTMLATNALVHDDMLRIIQRYFK
jgi:myo-inositol-1(or 4)-monophosphatase